MNDDLMNTPGYTPSRAVSDKTEKCNERAESFIPREGKSYACVLPKGHEGEHRGGGNCFKHGEYIGIHGCPVCFPDGAQVSFGGTSDKTEVRAACKDIVSEYLIHLDDGGTVECLGPIIERYIKPLLRSERIAAIEESAKRLEEYIIDGSSEAEKLLQTAADDIRALKEQSWPPYTL